MITIILLGITLSLLTLCIGYMLGNMDGAALHNRIRKLESENRYPNEQSMSGANELLTRKPKIKGEV